MGETASVMSIIRVYYTKYKRDRMKKKKQKFYAQKYGNDEIERTTKCVQTTSE